jgi:hypothetical protein
VFSKKLALIVPFPLPPAVTVHQEALLLAFQEEFEVTEKVVEPDAAETFLFEGATERVGAAALAVKVPAMLGA